MQLRHFIAVAALLSGMLPTSVLADTGASSATNNCASTYNVNTQQLNLGCVSLTEQPGTVYSVQMQLTQINPVTLSLAQAQINPAASLSKCVSKYSNTSGELSIGCLEIVDAAGAVLSEGNYVLRAENVAKPERFVLVDNIKSRSAIVPRAAAMGGILAVSFRSANNASLGAYTHLKYPSWGDRTHFGNDVLADCGEPIYAPGNGIVVDVVKSGGTNFDSLGNAVIIKHAGQGQNNKNIYSLFLHMKNTPQVSIGDDVTQNSQLGSIGTTGSANGICHSHVELRYFESRFSKYANIYGPGDVRNDSYALNNFENPNTFTLLNSSSPQVAIPYFDGTGSLIDPRNNGDCAGAGNFGCSRDYVALHAHGQQPSAGFFQVFRIPGVCEAVKLDGLTYAEVEVRSWSGYGSSSDSVYYTLNSLPAVVPLKSDTNWSLVAFKTVSPIPEGDSRTVEATCVAQVITDNNVTKKLSGTPMGFESDYFWGGNGSIIRHSNNQSDIDSQTGFGRDRDTAVLFNSKKTLSAFQVSSTRECRSIRFTSRVAFELSWKLWDEKDWRGSKTINDGDKFTFPTADNWWILKVKAPGTGENGTRVDAVCES